MNQMGGGCLVAAGLLGGAAIGVLVGQSSLGLVLGLVAGAAAAGLLTWWDARRRR